MSISRFGGCHEKATIYFHAIGTGYKTIVVCSTWENTAPGHIPYSLSFVAYSNREVSCKSGPYKSAGPLNPVRLLPCSGIPHFTQWMGTANMYD